MFTKMDKLAKRLKKETKGKTDVQSIVNYAAQIGYRTVFLNTKEGDKLISLYKLDGRIQNVEAFTITGDEKIIFVDGNLHPHDQRYLLLHELGHILLKHIGEANGFLKDKRYIEAEAETFVYAVISDKKNKKPLKLIIGFIFASLFFGTGAFTGYTYLHKIDATSDKNVIITRTGESYHLEGCISINNKDYILIPHKEAEKIYAPCKICNPN